MICIVCKSKLYFIPDDKKNYIKKLKTRSQSRILDAITIIKNHHPELTDIYLIDVIDTHNRNGNMVANTLIFVILSYIDKLNMLEVHVELVRGLHDTTAEEISKKFRIEYHKYLNVKMK